MRKRFVKMERINKRARILAATESLLREQGLAKTTTRGIVERAGVAEGTLYLYFKNRSELFQALFDERVAPFMPGFEALSEINCDKPIEVFLVELASQMLLLYHEIAPLSASLFAEPELLASYRCVMSARFKDQRIHPKFISQLQRYKDAGQIAPGIDIEVLGEGVFGACYSRAFHDELFGRTVDPISDTKFLVELIRMLMGSTA